MTPCPPTPKKWGCLHAWGVGDCSSASVHNSTKVMVLAEECGEVSRAVEPQQGSNVGSRPR